MKPKKKQLMTFRSTEEAFIAIASAAEYLGWGIAVPHSDDDTIVEGLVIGTEEYMSRVLPDEGGE